MKEKIFILRNKINNVSMLVKAKDEAVKRMNKIISANNTNLLKTDKKYLTPLDFEIKEECVCNSVDDAKKASANN